MTAFKERLNCDSFVKNLETNAFGKRCAVFSEIGSTNTYLKKNAEVLESGFVALADIQTGGRGRLGRSFESPSGGLYMSLLVKGLDDTGISSSTVKVAVAVCRAIEKVSSIGNDCLQIKWVNDIYYGGKKLCGILCELVKCGEENCLIIGVGINILPIARKVSPEVRKIATSIADIIDDHDSVISNDIRERLSAEILKNLENMLYRPLSCFIEEYRDRSCIIGKDIYVIKGSELIPAHAYGITDDAKLCVHFSDGHFEMIYSGDVSIREKK